MIKEQAREILPLVNDPEMHPRLIQYAEQRLEILRQHLETEKNPQKMSELQGAIAEIKRIFTLKAEVRGELEKKNAQTR